MSIQPTILGIREQRSNIATEDCSDLTKFLAMYHADTLP